MTEAGPDPASRAFVSSLGASCAGVEGQRVAPAPEALPAAPSDALQPGRPVSPRVRCPRAHCTCPPVRRRHRGGRVGAREPGSPSGEPWTVGWQPWWPRIPGPSSPGVWRSARGAVGVSQASREPDRTPRAGSARSVPWPPRVVQLRTRRCHSGTASGSLGVLPTRGKVGTTTTGGVVRVRAESTGRERREK